MKYLTPERLVRLQDPSDDRTYLAALGEWEGALKDYKGRLARIRSQLPGDLYQLIDAISLHDARVLDMWSGGRSQLTITLHPESDPSRLVILVYSLVAPPTVEQNALPASLCSQPVTWLYDELDLVRKTQRARPTFTHHILLSDGREVRLSFGKVAVRRPVPIVPVAPHGGVDPDSVRRSA